MMWDKKKKAYVFNDGVPLVETAPGWWMEIDGSGQLVATGSPLLGSIIQWGVLGHAAPDATGIDEDMAWMGSLSEYARITSPYNVISKKDNKVEAFWSITRAATLPVVKRDVIVQSARPVSIYAAGQGSLDSKTALMKSISGNFAGMIGAPSYDSDVVCSPAGAYDCAMYAWYTFDSAIYGSWTMKYNSSYSKKLVDERYGHDYVYKKGPDYANKLMRSNFYRYVTPTVADICAVP
jgi:hypothetical protein